MPEVQALNPHLVRTSARRKNDWTHRSRHLSAFESFVRPGICPPRHLSPPNASRGICPTRHLGKSFFGTLKITKCNPFCFVWCVKRILCLVPSQNPYIWSCYISFFLLPKMRIPRSIWGSRNHPHGRCLYRHSSMRSKMHPSQFQGWSKAWALRCCF